MNQSNSETGEQKQPLVGIDLLRALSLAFGPSGCEGNVADLVRENAGGYADEILADRMGSVILHRAGTGERQNTVLLCAHMDEAGFMIQSIDGDGYLHMTALSGRDPSVLVGRRVTVGDETRKTIGYIGVKPTHLGGSGDYDSLYIDIGAKDREDAESRVKIGDFGTYRSDFVRFGKDGGKIKGKALDSRLGCAVLCETLRRLREKDIRLPYDLAFAFTCREKVGSSGAVTAANTVKPAIALVLEGSAVSDVDGTPATGRMARLGMGACVPFADRGTVYDRALVNLIFDAAQKNAIPCQLKEGTAGSNDAGPVSRTMAGVRCGTIGTPARYLGTASNVADVADFWNTCDLLEAVLLSLGNVLADTKMV